METGDRPVTMSGAERQATWRARQRSGLLYLGITVKREALVDKLIDMKFLDPDFTDDIQAISEATVQLIDFVLEN